VFVVACWFSCLSPGRVAIRKRERQGGTRQTAADAEVKQGPLVITVRGSGDARSVESVKIIPPVKRGVVITYLIPDGSQVSSNDVVARFNTDDMERKIKDLDVAAFRGPEQTSFRPDGPGDPDHG